MVIKSLNPYNKVKGSCVSVSLFVPKDLGNRWTDRVLLNKVASHRSWEGYQIWHSPPQLPLEASRGVAASKIVIIAKYINFFLTDIPENGRTTIMFYRLDSLLYRKLNVKMITFSLFFISLIKSHIIEITKVLNWQFQIKFLTYFFIKVNFTKIFWDFSLFSTRMERSNF